MAALVAETQKVQSGNLAGLEAGLRFDSLEQAQAYLDRWEERWADIRPAAPHEGTAPHGGSRQADVPRAQQADRTGTETSPLDPQAHAV